ncbi:MAG TPA: carbamoyltransferase C-terminal domain-containing protein [Planctomycetota bacterium]|nr:carbamoyltransferase C-terminal domain-containing protein [Planctomycetota bacterium]
MTLILGVNAFHPDASACLLRDGKLIAAVAEERLGNRAKHIAGFPSQAIRSVLREAAADVKDIDFVALGHDHNSNLGAKIAHVAAHPVKTAANVISHFARRAHTKSMSEQIAEACGARADECRFKVLQVEHHLAHIASSFFCSDFDEAAGFSYDGSGDFVTAMYARCAGNKIEILDRVYVPHSLGFFYTALCQFIGFDRFGEEYKVMGLSAYGEPAYLDLMQHILRRAGSGQFRVDQIYVQPFSGRSFDECMDERGEIVLPPMYTQELVKKLGPPRKRGEALTQREKDIAHSCQRHFEDVVIACANWLHSVVPSANLVTAGGCALNGVCNARILRDTPFKKSYIQCAASDDGTGIGAAFYVWNVLLNKPREGAIEHAYFGPAHSEREMEEALRGHQIQYERLERRELIERAAKLLNAGQVIGWYQGRCEWGPRALGNRSILAHPGWPGMKDLINKKIKRREAFRPFAPTILAERVPDFFEQTIESPFMMHVVRIKEEKRSALAAVTHEDFTGRLHTVTRAQNELYYDLIAAFEKESGVPVVLNTSFNENEPIVDTPEQAVSCYVRNDVDALVMGPFLAVKAKAVLSAEC